MPLLRLLLICLFSVTFTRLPAQPPLEANYDEAKVPAYTLPDVLTTTNERLVKNKTTWETRRRPEIIHLFEENVYGQMPNTVDHLSYSIKNENASAMDGKAHLKEVLIEVTHNQKLLRINLVLFVPTRPKEPVPVLLLINNRSSQNTDPTRTHKSEFWPAEMVIDSGYAVAAFQVGELAPDDSVGYVNGALQLYPQQLTASNGMRTIGAWAWGASRVLDYIETDAELDARKVAVIGHSRGGKAALWAAAQDQRFALCFSNCSGNTGAALSHRRFGETIRRINTTFPHWFTPNYKRFNDKEASLPLDQHLLLATIAPRPLYVTNASKDLWADPRGTYLSVLQVRDVYALYGIRINLPLDPPGVNQPLLTSRVGYHIREGEHDLTAYDWRMFLQFTGRHLK
jgi:pimeloyl-ACP methyl ester carboxylesterase